MHDALIVATAKRVSYEIGRPVAVVTRDREITESGAVDVLWA